MRIKIKQLFFVLVYLCISSNLFSQPIIKDKTQAYNYWAKRGIIEMVYSYMQDYIATKDTNKITNEHSGAKAYRAKFISNIEKKDTNTIKKDFESIISLLRGNKWGTTADSICNPLIDNYKQRMPLNDHFFSVSTKYNGNKIWDEKKKYILNNYSNELKSIEINTKQIKLTDPLKIPNDDSNKKSIRKYLLASKFIFLSFIVGLIIGSFSIFIYSKSCIYSILSDEKRKYLIDLRNSHERYLFKYIGLFAILKRSKDNYKSNKKDEGLINQIEQLNRQISVLSIEKSKLLNENVELGETIERLKDHDFEQKSNQASKKIEVDLNSNTIYYTIPESDGSFKIANGKNTKEMDCFYKIEVDKNNQKGKLYFISSDFDSRALDNIDYYLNPVCEIENISERTKAQRIKMGTPGFVFLNGESWKIDVDNKVIVKLI